MFNNSSISAVTVNHYW